jgi:hypothetical protein
MVLVFFHRRFSPVIDLLGVFYKALAFNFFKGKSSLLFVAISAHWVKTRV